MLRYRTEIVWYQVCVSFGKRNEPCEEYFKIEESKCVTMSIEGLMNEHDIRQDPSEWRLYIDSSKYSSKAVFLYNGNQKPSIPIDHFVVMKGRYDTMDLILKLINYKKHNWAISGDLKTIARLLGRQGDFTK